MEIFLKINDRNIYVSNNRNIWTRIKILRGNKKKGMRAIKNKNNKLETKGTQII